MVEKTPEIDKDTPKARLYIPENQRFAGESALVTGVSKPNSIGAALARGLAYFGTSGILMTATPASAELGASMVKEVEEEGVHGAWVGSDLSTLAGIEAVIEEMTIRREEFGGRYRILMFNQGVNLDERLEDLSYEHLRKTLAINLEGTMMLASRVIKTGLMPRGYGRIVINGSFVAHGNKGGQEAYGASKAALAGFIANAAQDLGEFGITVNGVFPGFIETEMTDKATANAPMYREAYTVGAAAGRLGWPEDVAFHMLNFADPRAGFVTGQTLVVDGGIGNPAVIRRLIENGYVRLNQRERKAVMDLRRQEKQAQANPGGQTI